MGMFFLGVIVGVIGLCAAALIAVGIEGEEEQEKELMDISDRAKFKYIHDRITSLRDEYIKSAKSLETGVAILTARTNSIRAYVDDYFDAHELAFHTSPRKDKKK